MTTAEERMDTLKQQLGNLLDVTEDKWFDNAALFLRSLADHVRHDRDIATIHLDNAAVLLNSTSRDMEKIGKKATKA